MALPFPTRRSSELRALSRGCVGGCRGPSWVGGSARQLLHQIDVLLLRVVLAGAHELGPGFVLGGGDEVEEAGLRAADDAFRALFVQGVQDRKSTRLNSSH